MKSEIRGDDTPDAIKFLHHEIMILLSEYEPQIVLSVLYTIIAKLTVVLEISREDYMKALGSAYDAFVLLSSEHEGGVQ